MNSLFDKRVKLILEGGNSNFLRKGLKGIEKESLRVTKSGSISSLSHPVEWGSALTNPHITTDYSEALPEFITPPFEDIDKTLEFLKDIHNFAISNLPEDEILWNSSMPCQIIDDKEISIAKYGNSNSGQMRHIYRLGLDYRYGRKMQAIAGIHYNYSLPKHFWEFSGELFPTTASDNLVLRKNSIYLGLARNYLRYGWLILLLFGCSPACCRSYLPQRSSRFRSIKKNTLVAPYGTSLRMSDIGYKNKNQSHLKITLNSIQDYINALLSAMNTPYPEYEAIGIYEENKQIQLSANLLQIENEYYSSIRPKGNPLDGQRPSASLQKDGIHYIEMRSLDVDSFNPFGIGEECLLFCEIFLIFCLFEDSPPISDKEYDILEYNDLSVALRGRQPNLKLIKNPKEDKTSILDWSESLLDRMRGIGEALDSTHKTTRYSKTLNEKLNHLKNPDFLPSAKFHQLLIDSNAEYHDFNLNLSLQHSEQIRKSKPNPEKLKYFEEINDKSWEKQKKLETESTQFNLDDYIKSYLSG